MRLWFIYNCYLFNAKQVEWGRVLVLATPHITFTWLNSCELLSSSTVFCQLSGKIRAPVSQLEAPYLLQDWGFYLLSLSEFCKYWFACWNKIKNTKTMKGITEHRQWAETVAFAVDRVEYGEIQRQQWHLKIMKEGAALSDVFSEASA